MSNDPGFELFAFNIQQDVISSSKDNISEAFAEDQFSELVLEYLADAGEIDDLQLCSHQARGIKVNGYDFYNDDKYLDLFVTLFTGDYPPVRVSKTEIQAYFKRLHTFFDRSVTQKYKNLEESSPAFDLADKIHHLRNNITNIRLFVLTDGIANVDAIEDEKHGPYKISHHVWDMERLFRLWSSGNRLEPIEIDFNNDFGQTITCLPMPEENSKYTTYMAIISGETLADLYEKYGPRLLERNVRAFLQMRGDVNKGIRDTIRNEPDMFLAYNNGISATAEWIDIGESPNRMPVIRRIRDFQIVNGAQTTASIYHTHIKDKQDVSRVYVQVKLTVLKNADDADRIVPKISQCANSQNKINAADFTSNDPFHIQIQKLSRSIWAPANRGSQQETHWYYERARGQYQDDKGREKTPKLRSLFGEQNPTSQRFTKTDLAKFENSWDQLPHIVSLGAEKNYRDFILRYREKGEFEPNADYFQLLVSKAIFFKRTDKIINGLNFGGYKANIVTYTIAILSRLTEKRIDLEKVWKNQDISSTLEEAIVSISGIVHQHITNPPGGKNITEWCKKEECWNSLLKLKVNIPPALEKELVNKEVVKQRDIKIQKQIDILENSDDEITPHYKDEKEAPNYDIFIKSLKPHKWMRITKDAEISGMFSSEQIFLLKKVQKMSFRRVPLTKEQIEKTKQILITLNEEMSSAALES
jgi:hypothetical protein